MSVAARRGRGRGRSGARSRRRPGPAAARILAAGLLACLAAGSAAACSNPLDARVETLAENRNRWESDGPADYSYVYNEICFCAPPLAARVEVRDGVVVSAAHPETGEPLPAEDVERVPTVEELFAEVEAAFREDPAVASVTYDPQFGHPTDAYFDFRLNVADEERGFTAKELEPLEPGDGEG